MTKPRTSPYHPGEIVGWAGPVGVSSARAEAMNDDGNLRFPEDIAPPVGSPCGACEEPIEAGDFGQMVPHIGEDRPGIWPIHGECLVRSVMGGIEHLTAPPGHALGSCYGGSTLTRRESAVAAYAWLREHPA